MLGSPDTGLPGRVGQSGWYAADGISNFIVPSHLALPTHSQWPSQDATDYTRLHSLISRLAYKKPPVSFRNRGFFSCTPGGTRTHDLWFRRPALYPAELPGQIVSLWLPTRPNLPQADPVSPAVNSAAATVLCTSMATVMGPTPPGTGVREWARPNISSAATSPTSR